MQPFEIFAGAPAGFEACLLDPAIAISAARAGAVGLVDAEFAAPETVVAALRQLAGRSASGTFALKLAPAQWSLLESQEELVQLVDSGRLRWLVLALGGVRAQTAPAELSQGVESARRRGLRILIEVTSSEEAALAAPSAPDGFLAKGHEAEGRVGEETSFVLLQRLVKERTEPIFVHGGIGLHSAAACLVGGARGVVLTSSVLLTRESPLADAILARLARLDGTEPQIQTLNTSAAGPAAAVRYRLYARPGTAAQTSLHGLLRESMAGDESRAYAALVSYLQAPSRERAWLLGQDVAYAAALARRFGSTAAIVNAVREAASAQLSQCAATRPLAEGAPLARSHATRYPIVQGAMTRVSDNAEFAGQVADAGALPFLAVALLRGEELDTLLAQTQKRLADKPWGVGILGFVPPELRQEQLAVVLRYKPPFALIAGGRPDQAQELEAQGIRTYLHVPSPLLLRSFIELGARRFIFEGRECGGHVGPRSSFVLWEAMVAELLAAAEAGQELSQVHVLLAGGIGDARSAAMAAAIAAPLLRHGVRVGVLMGTAYLFTEEAVRCGAVTDRFQREVVRCDKTVLFETGPGHAIRCLDSPYRQVFDARRRELTAGQQSADQTRLALEMMNVGRLRVASKGVTRVGNELTQLSGEEQWQDGMFMVGQIAALRDAPLSMQALHETVSTGGTEFLSALQAQLPKAPAAPLRSAAQDIAIVGMSCLFPQANQLAAYWRNILNRVDAITEIPKSHWAWETLYDPDPLARDKIYSKWGGFLSDIPLDPRRYGIPPSSLSSIDPMQLLLLEVTRAALADAGYAQRGFMRGRTSVILANAGHGPITSLYSLRSMLGWLLADLPEAEREALANRLPEWTEDSFPGYLGNVAAGRISNRFDLGGVNFSIDAACASSLAALYLSMQELRARTSDLVLLSAVDTHNQPGDYLSFAKTHALSPRGRCRTFDASADGIVISEGAAVLVLKRREDAERDGDRIYALVRGVGGSSDGRDRSLTAPRPEGQLLALERAYADAGVSPATVSLVEAHGTGTVAGDRAEVAALRRMWQQAGAAERSCAIGSVKTMIGHTKCAAGLASLIKVAKALHHRILPPTMGVTTPSPACELEQSPFYLCTEPRPWLHDSASPRRAGVSAFGFGGTNFHAVLQEYGEGAEPAAATVTDHPATPDWPSELFTLAAATRAELAGRVEQLRAEVHGELAAAATLVGPVESEAPQRSLRQLAHAHYLRGVERPAATGLTLAVVAGSLQDLHDKLGDAATHLKASGPLKLQDPRGIYCFAEPLARTRKVAFLFPGQGSQRVGMMGDLAQHFPLVRQSLERSEQSLRGGLPRPLGSYLYPPSAFSDAERRAQQAALTDTRIAQPALGAADLAALALLRSLGIDAELLAGHSYGEYVALHAAGVFAEPALLAVSAERGRLLAEPPDGVASAMAAIGADAAVVAGHLQSLPGVTLANHNSPVQCVISGRSEAVEAAVTALAGRGLAAKKIAVSAAFHSPLMEYAKAPLVRAIDAAATTAPQRVVFSNLDAAPYPAERAAVATRLGEHLVRPVLFAQTVQAMHAAGAGVFVEVGPGSVLSGLVDATLRDLPHLALPLDRPGKDGVTALLHLLAQLCASGVAVDQGALYRWRRDAHTGLGEQPAPQRSATAVPGTAKPQLLYAMNSARIERVSQPPAHGEKRSSMKSPLPISPAPVPAAKAAPERPSAIAAAPPPSAPSPAPLPLASAPPWVTPSTGAEQIMLQFQQTMLQMSSSFLETQQRVMLAYLESLPGAAFSQPSLAAGPTATLPLARPAAPLPPPRSAPEAVTPLPAVPTSPAIMPVRAAPLATMAAAAVSTAPKVIEVQELVEHAPPEVALQMPTLAPAGEVDLGAQLLQIVSERTGYPVEMLDPDLDLEADLGIDSIKRIEILNTFRKLLPVVEQQKLEKDVEKLAGSKTLKSIISFMQKSQAGVGGPPDPPNEAPAVAPAHRLTAGAESKEQPSPQTLQTLQRALRREGPLPALAAGPAPSAPAAGPLLVVADHFSGSAAVCAELAAAGVAIVHAAMGSAAERDGDPRYRVNLDDEEDVRRLVQQLTQEQKTLAGLLYLVGLAPERTDSGGTSGFPAPLARLLTLCKHLHPFLETGTTLCCSRLATGAGDEAADSDTAGEAAQTQAALGGALRSLAREWPRARLRAVALAPDCRPDDLGLSVAELVCAELCDTAAPVETLYRSDGRRGVQAEPAPLSILTTSEALADLSPHSVVVITGGARGVTAAAAAELARRYRPTLVLLGRSPLPVAAESAATAGLHTVRELKAALMAELRRSGQPVALSAVESAYEALLREREVRDNLAKLTALGAQVHYHAVDVSDPAATAAIIAQIYAAHGRIDGLIHGAGIIKDAPVHKKSLPAAKQVYETKVLSAWSLLQAVRVEELTFCLFFSSIVAHTGNAGQVDYAAANAALNQLASDLDRRIGGRVVSLLWGPWRGGMVRPELEEHLRRSGWELIEESAGAAACIDELRLGRKGEVEVLLTAKVAAVQEEPPPRPDAAGSAALAVRLAEGPRHSPAPGVTEQSLRLELGVDRYLLDHSIDGVPVLPMAGALSLIGEAAALSCPGWHLGRISGLTLLSGVRLVGGSCDLILRCTQKRSTESTRQVSVEIVSAQGKQRPHYRATVELVPTLADAFSHDAVLPAIPPGEPPLPVAALYQRWLFHGPLFQGITAIDGFTKSGVSGRIRGSRPDACLRGAKPHDAWLIDPVLLDSAMQLAGVWARHFAGITVLPMGCQSLQRMGAPKSADCVGRVHIRDAADPSELRCDVGIYDSDGTPVLLMRGLFGIGSVALNRLAEPRVQLRPAS